MDTGERDIEIGKVGPYFQNSLFKEFSICAFAKAKWLRRKPRARSSILSNRWSQRSAQWVRLHHRICRWKIYFLHTSHLFFLPLLPIPHLRTTKPQNSQTVFFLKEISFT